MAAKELFEASVRIGLDTRDVGPQVTRFGGLLAGKLGAVGSAAGAALSAGITAGITAGIAGLAGGVAAAIKSVMLASDAEESGSKFLAVFGETSDATAVALDDFAKAAGRSRYELKAMAGDVGALLQGFGFSADRVSDMSVAVTKLANDLSSFHNVSERDALDSLRSGLSGEAEPLKKFGVVVNEARIQEEAFRLGLIKRKEEMTAAIKATTVLSLVTRDTAAASGDAVKTAGSLANSVRGLTGGIKDLATEFGALLLPSVTAVVNSLRSVVDAVRAQAPILREWGNLLGEITGNMMVLISEVAAKFRATMSEGLAGLVRSLTGGVTDSFGAMVTSLLEKLAVFTADWEGTWALIKQAADFAINEVKLYAAYGFQAITSGASELASTVGGFFRDLFRGLTSGLDVFGIDTVKTFAGIEASANRMIDNLLSRFKLLATLGGPLGGRIADALTQPTQSGGLEDAFRAGRGDSSTARAGVENLLSSLGLDPASVSSFISEHEDMREGILGELARLWEELAAERARREGGPEETASKSSLGIGGGMAAGLSGAIMARNAKLVGEAFARSIAVGGALLGTPFGDMTGEGPKDWDVPKEREPRAEFLGFSEFAKKLQLGISNREREDPAAVRIAKETEKHAKAMVGELKGIRAEVARPRVAVAG